MTTENPQGPPATAGQKYFVKVEGEEHRWPDDTITTEEVIELGGWDVSLGAIMIDEDGVESTLQPGQTIEPAGA